MRADSPPALVSVQIMRKPNSVHGTYSRPLNRSFIKTHLRFLDEADAIPESGGPERERELFAAMGINITVQPFSHHFPYCFLFPHDLFYNSRENVHLSANYRSIISINGVKNTVLKQEERIFGLHTHCSAAVNYTN